MVKSSRQSKCRVCRSLYTKRSISHKACSPDCAIELAKREREKKEAKAARQAKVKARTRRVWLKVAQDAVNMFVRVRDAAKPCVSCGQTTTSDFLTGGAWDCGHYRTIGANPSTRYNLFNMAKQCKRCNRDLSGSHVAYRVELVKRIGEERVLRIEHDNAVKKFDISYLERLTAVFNKRTRVYLKLRAKLKGA